MLRGWVRVKVSIPARPEWSRGCTGIESMGGGVGVAVAAVLGRSTVKSKEQFLIPQP